MYVLTFMWKHHPWLDCSYSNNYASLCSSMPLFTQYSCFFFLLLFSRSSCHARLKPTGIKMSFYLGWGGCFSVIWNSFSLSQLHISFHSWRLPSIPMPWLRLRAFLLSICNPASGSGSKQPRVYIPQIKDNIRYRRESTNGPPCITTRTS